MITDIPAPRRFSLTNSLAKRTRHAFRVQNVQSASRTSVTRFIESKRFAIAIVIPTVYILFIHDFIGVSGAPNTRSLTATIGALDVLAFTVLLAEMCCNIYAYQTSYLPSTLFFLDLISLVSLIPDFLQLLLQLPDNSIIRHLAIARIARIARIATRLARIPRLVDILSCSAKRKEVEVNAEPSAIARKLELRISTKIVFAMVVLLVIAWLCNPGLSVDKHAQVALNEFIVVAQVTNFSGSIYQQVFTTYTSDYDVLYLRVGAVYLINDEYRLRRTQDIYVLDVESGVGSAKLLVEDEQTTIAALAITQTICSILILCAACVLLSKDMLVLVVHPIERMLSLIKRLTSTISAFTDSNNNTGDRSESDSDASDTGSDSSSDGADDKLKRFGVLFVALTRQRWKRHRFSCGLCGSNHMEMDAMRKLENQKKKLLAVLGAGALGWGARRKYQRKLDMFRKREHVAKEIITTERTYVNSLQVLSNVFKHPLLDSGIIPIDAANSIFLGLDLIISFNSDLLAKLEPEFAPWNIHSQLGNIFLGLDDMVNAYSGFINNYNNASTMLTKHRENNPKFSHFIEEQESLEECNHLKIEQFLITPIQRTPRYFLLLEQLAKFTPADHPDFMPVTAAMEEIKRITNIMNERKRENESRTALHSLYMRLEPTLDILMEPHCMYVKDGSLSHEGETFTFFLLNSVLLKCQPREGGIRMILVQDIPIVATSTITTVADSPHYGLHNAFQLESVLLCAPSQASQIEWIEAISQTIQKLDHKRDHSPGHASKARKEKLALLDLDMLTRSSGNATPDSLKSGRDSVRSSRKSAAATMRDSHSRHGARQSTHSTKLHRHSSTTLADSNTTIPHL